MGERFLPCPPSRLVVVLHEHKSPLENSTQNPKTRFKDERASRGSEAWSVPSKMSKLQRGKDEEENIVFSLYP